MSKAYWRSAGSGALGLAGQWHSMQLWRPRIKSVSPLAILGRTILWSLVLTVVVGMVIGVYQNMYYGMSDAAQAGTFAYRYVGLTINATFTSFMMALSLGDYVSVVQGNVLFYLEVPYQLCAFAGASITSAGIGLLHHFATTAPTV